MSPARRAALLQLAGAPLAAARAAAVERAIERGYTLRFPRDHGAHPDARTEWWYATGWLGTEQAPTHGFQITFFRSRTGLAEDNPSRFAARQLLFAHAAVVDLAARRHAHDQRIGRWTGDPQAANASAALDRGAVRIGHWSFTDDGRAWRAGARGDALAFELTLARTQPLLLQGDAGFSRKGPQEAQASHYYSEPQLAAGGRIGNRQASGRAWLDHEWSDELLDRDAAGWDWIGINLFDGSALTAFRLRRRDGSALWAGGSFRAAGTAGRSFGPGEVRFTPGRSWRSPGSNSVYPVQWTVDTPAGRWAVNALLDAQELDSRASTGSIYWEGLSELLDERGRRVGLGYLEMTGYAAPLKL